MDSIYKLGSDIIMLNNTLYINESITLPEERNKT